MRNNFSDEFVELKCPNCGGKIEITELQADHLFIEFGEDVFVYIGSGGGQDRIECTYCGSSFTKKQQVEKYSSSIASVSIKNTTVNGDLTISNVNASAFNQTGQNVTGQQINITGDFVGKDKVVHGDKVGGRIIKDDKISGDVIIANVGVDSRGVSIGKNARSTVIITDNGNKFD